MSDAHPAAEQNDLIVLIGNPNTGKSTLFSGLAGIFQQTGNYPGVTVEKKLARCQLSKSTVTLVDLPGTYSLAPRSPDEMIAVDVLLGRQPDLAAPRVVLCIVDASNLERNLFLVTQVLELNLPTVIALNMIDVAEQKGIQIDAEQLAKRLGVPVIPIQAKRKQGLDKLKQALEQALVATLIKRPSILPVEIQSSLQRLHVTAAQLLPPGQTSFPDFLLERTLLDTSGYLDQDLAHRQPDLYQALLRERASCTSTNLPLQHAEAIARYQWIGQQLDGVLTHSPQTTPHQHASLDRILTHKIWGLCVFALVMLALFCSIVYLGEPLMSLIEKGFEWISESIKEHMQPGPLRSMITDGIIAGAGGVIVFVPQIMLLFLFIAILEDCGYMSRAAYLMDRIMSQVGLSGKSFIPLLSSFACAIPGIMATRTIEHRRDRLVTMLVAPLMSCSARLPVYTLMTMAFFPDVNVWGFLPVAALAIFAMYMLGILVAMLVAWLLKKTALQGEVPPFVMELPPYHIPSIKLVLRRMFQQAWSFIYNAGTLILTVSILVWAALYYPHGDGTDSPVVQAELQRQQTELEQRLANLPAAAAGRDALQTQLAKFDPQHPEHEQIINGIAKQQSFLGHAGRWLEPVVKPLGWDWRIGCAVLASFPAREVVVGTLGVIYEIGDEIELDDDESRSKLEKALQQATWPETGAPVFTIPVALSIMVFFALCAQCASTLAVIKRESGSWGWTIFTFVYMTGIAYLAAWLTTVIARIWL
jgi:ferrous iron transport protein B